METIIPTGDLIGFVSLPRGERPPIERTADIAAFATRRTIYIRNDSGEFDHGPVVEPKPPEYRNLPA